MDPIVRRQRCFCCNNHFSTCLDLLGETKWAVIKSKCATGVGLHNLCGCCAKEIVSYGNGFNILGIQWFDLRTGEPIKE